MNHLYYQELQTKFDEKLTSLARCDVDVMNCESQLIKQERYSLEYHLQFEKLHSLNQKRKLIAARLASLRIELEKDKQNK